MKEFYTYIWLLNYSWLKLEELMYLMKFLKSILIIWLLLNVKEWGGYGVNLLKVLFYVYIVNVYINVCL